MTAIARAVRSQSAARIVTEVTTPTLLAPALLIAVAFHEAARSGISALGWGLFAGVFVGLLPISFLKHGVRQGRYRDHHVDQREDRLLPFLFTFASVAAGCLILAFGGAPQALLALIVAMLAGLSSVLAINHWWKISVHSGTAAGAAVIVGLVFGPIPGVAAAGAATACAWSRHALGKHTSMQIIAGLVVGAAVASTVFPALY